MASEPLVGREAILDGDLPFTSADQSDPSRKAAPWTVHIAVTILDVRKVFGRTEFLVKPALGGGEPRWVSRERVRVAPEGKETP